jgi:acyl-CoA hydrolase
VTVIVSPDDLDLAAFVRPGDHIVWGQSGAEPTALVEALIAQAEAIGGLSAFTALSFSGLLTGDVACKINLSIIGAIGSLRIAAAAHALDIIPCHISQIAPMIDRGEIGCDVAFVQVSPPNAEGDYSFGLVSDHVQNAVRKARVVIAEVNDQTPFTYGDSVLPRQQITCAVPVSRTPVEVSSAKLSAIDHAIAKWAASYVEDGSVLQVGVGATPDAILQLLGDRRDLGVHSGMIGDSVVDLIECGAVTNALKPIDRGVSITGALIGTRRLYKFAHLNYGIGMRPSAYTHGEAVLTKIPKLVTINSALEIDLTGQCNAEQIGDTYLGGTGGQSEFARAGIRSAGGRSILALPSTTKGGAVSRITASLSGPVTTSRSDVDVVVTEYGAAELRGQTLAERARRLVAIAHPDFREDLDRSAHAIARRRF